MASEQGLSNREARGGESEQGPADRKACGGDDVGSRAVPAAAIGPSATAPRNAPIPRRKLWPVLLGLLTVLAAVGWLGWRLLGGPEPLRVLVAIDVQGSWWEGSKSAALLADLLTDRLAELGFDPVHAGDPKVTAVMEQSASLDEAARALGAAFVVSGHIAPKQIEWPGLDGLVELRVEAATIELGRSDRAEPWTTEAVSAFAAAPTAERATEQILRVLAIKLADRLVPAMMRHPSLRHITASDDPALLDRTAPAREYLAARRAALDRAEAAYAKLDSELRQGNGHQPRPTILSPPTAEDRLVAVRTAGVLLSRAPVRALYSLGSYELVRDLALEQVAWIAPGGKASVLWRGYNAFTSPSVAGSSGQVALIEDLWGRARALWVMAPGAPPMRLRLERDRKISVPRLSPDGRAVALIDRACRNCPRALSVLDLFSHPGHELRRLDAADFEQVGDFGWLGAGRLMVVARPVDAHQALWVIELRTGHRESLLAADDGTPWSEPVATSDGRVLAAIHGASVWTKVAEQEAQKHPVGAPLSGLALSPDGLRAAFALRSASGKGRIAVLELASSQLLYATGGSNDARAPQWSMDGGRIYFELHHTDPVFGRRRRVVRVAWVPAP